MEEHRRPPPGPSFADNVRWRGTPAAPGSQSGASALHTGEELRMGGQDPVLCGEIGLERRDVVLERTAEDDAIAARKHASYIRAGAGRYFRRPLRFRPHAYG